MKIIIITFFMIALSCSTSNKSNLPDEELNKLLSVATIKYYQTKNKKHLVKVYDTLQYNKEFKKNGLSGKNSLPLISLLMNLKKYDELEKLLNDNKTINSYNRINTLNVVKYLNEYTKNNPKSKSYIYDNLKRIKDTISKSPKDSLLYADYFSMKMYLNGKAKTLKDIDSMQSVNNKYSEIFYKSILKEAIEAYPDEYLLVK